VPFEELVGGHHETLLADAFQTTERVALIGPIGSGKSSLLEYVTSTSTSTSTSPEALAPIWISVGHESDEMLRDPPEFARHLILEVVRWARDSRAMGEEQRRAILAQTTPTLPTASRTHREDFSLKLALGWLEPGISSEVEETVANPAVERARSEFITSLDRLVDLIRTDLGRVPILLIDDSDRWLRLDGSVRDAVLQGFFIDTCRMLAERNWAVAMAVHPDYCSTSAYREAAGNGYFTVQHGMPDLATPDVLGRLFAARIQSVAEDEHEYRSLDRGEYPISPIAVPPDAVFEDGFEALLHRYYERSDRNLRAVLTVVQQALIEAIGLGEIRISTASLRESSLGLAFGP
jgi:energy-coupling factor transporter ATP-binding protein EcfA2